MSNGFPTGHYTIRTSDVPAFPVGAEVSIEGSGSSFELRVASGPQIPMEPADGSICLRSTSTAPLLVVCPLSPGVIGGLVSAVAVDSNGGGQWTAEGGGDPEGRGPA